jgi:hypothetical protein
MDLNRRITAHHEAAHAVIAFRYGMPIEVVAVCKAGPLHGYVRTTHPALLWKALKKGARALTWPAVLRDTERHAMSLLAGGVAEAKLHGTPLRSHFCESDLHKCHALCHVLSLYADWLIEERGMSVPRIDADAMANALRRRTARILSHPTTWRAVTALAADLETWGRLSGEDAADVVQWTRRIHNQLALLLPLAPPVRPTAIAA